MIKTAKRHVSVDITFGTIFWVLFSLLAIKFFAEITNVVILVFFALLITLSVNPLVNRLESKKINRKLSSLMILFAFFGVLIGAGVLISRPLTVQTELFLQKLPGLLSTFGLTNGNLSQFQSQIALVPAQVYKIAVGTFEGVVTTLSVVVMSFYMILEMKHLSQNLNFWFGEKKAARYLEIIQKLESQLGDWIRGQLILMLIVGVISFVGYTLIGLPYTLALAVFAGLLELIPNIGPTVAAVPAILVGISLSPAHAVLALVVAILTQQIENQLLVPVIMKKTVGLNPVLTIIALFIGVQLGGPIMGIIALPAALSLRVIFQHIRVNKLTNIPEIG